MTREAILEAITKEVAKSVNLQNTEPCEYSLKEGGCPFSDAGEPCLRDISLADILIAIGKSGEIVETDLYGHNLGIATGNGGGGKYERERWDLTKPIHDQPLPTLQFIHDLLVDKN